MKDSKFDLTGKIALITGASKGIGEAIAQGLAQYGAKVIVSSRSQEAVDEVAQSICQKGGEAVGIACHVGKREEIDALMEKALAQYGDIDILINNAATNPVFGPLLKTDSEAFDKIIDINVKGPFFLCKRVFPIMKEKGGGSIINISSVGGLSPEPGLGVYSMSKAALINLTKAMAKEWGGYGIRANVICPGLIKTKFSQALWEDEKMLERFQRNLPLPRIGEPDDVVGMTIFLASEASGYCTGGVYTLDGGLTV